MADHVGAPKRYSKVENSVCQTYNDDIIPRDALQGHRRSKNPVAYVFLFILFILPRSRKRQCLILIEV